MTKEVLHEIIERDRDEALNGYNFWCHPDFEGRTLSDLRNSDATGEDREGETTDTEIPVEN